MDRQTRFLLEALVEIRTLSEGYTSVALSNVTRVATNAISNYIKIMDATNDYKETQSCEKKDRR